MSNKIYIGNLSYQTSEQALQDKLSDFGSVLSCKIITDRDTGRSKGFGFAEFDNADSMNKAIEELNGAELDGRPLRVNEAQDKPRRF